MVLSLAYPIRESIPDIFRMNTPVKAKGGLKGRGNGHAGVFLRPGVDGWCRKPHAIDVSRPEGANRSDVWRGLVYAENSGAPDVYGKEEGQ